MPETLVYEALVLRTFSEQALRTALLIDDQFPTYADLIAGRAAEYSDTARAARLYEQFRTLRLPCDVVNSLSGEGASDAVERIRKSDLIVLDYHLTPSSEDSTQSTELMARLADSPHFNTIVLYTQEADLARVWRDVACRLRGGWMPPATLLADDAEALEAWDRLSSGDELPDVPEILVESRAIDTHESQRGAREEKGRLVSQIRALGVTGDAAARIVEALVHREVLRRFPGQAWHGKRPVYGRFLGEQNVIWLQCSNCFIAIVRKARLVRAPVPSASEVVRGQVEDQGPVLAETEASTPEQSAGTDPEGIMECLHAALLDWRPSFAQIVLSEVQNRLELEALATGDEKLRRLDTQVGLSYYVLQQLKGVAAPWTAPELTPAVRSVIDRIVDGIRRYVSTNEDLEQTVAALLVEELERSGWPTAIVARTTEATWAAAAKLGRCDGNPDKTASLLHLNAFLSTEPARRRHVTTGAVFREQGTADLWVCVSPACDMVPRDPGTEQQWLWALHPVRPMLALRLHRESETNGLEYADRGGHVFVELEEEERPVPFRVVGASTSLPAYEMLFPTDAARLGAGGRTFTAYTLRGGRSATTPAAIPPTFSAVNFEVVAQLRPPYASRVLQLAGQHLSRIGVDFVSLLR